MTGSRIRVLGAGFAAVPSSHPLTAAVRSMIDALRGDLDLVTLKTEDLSHIKRIDDARMFRVPVGRASPKEQLRTYARAVTRQIESEPYRVVHAFDPWAGAAAAALKADRGFVLVYEMATFPAAPGELDPWLEAHALAARHADRILVQSEASRQALSTDPALAGKLEVMRPSVDIGGFDWEDAPAARGAPRLLFLGSFTPSRGLSTVLDGIAAVCEHRPLQALFVGDRSSSRRSALRAAVDDRALSSRIDVRGEPKPHQISSILAAADLCIAPSAGSLAAGCAELPQPLLEYMACYRPVVAADVPGVSEIVRDEVEGLLYPAGSSSALADAIQEVLRDAVLRERITDAAYRRVRDDLNSGARRRRLRALYEQLAPASQTADPWLQPFSDVTGLITLDTGAIELIEDTGETAAVASTDTAETAAPREREELTQPGASAVPTTDTRPGLVVPDTDPGRA